MENRSHHPVERLISAVMRHSVLTLVIIAIITVICAVLSSNFDFAIPPDTCFAGEVGLSGEIRPVSQTDRRIIEAQRLGFRKMYISAFGSPDNVPEGIEVIKVGDVPALCRSLFPK